MTINQLLQQIVNRFKCAKLYFGHGTRNAEDEALALIFYALNISFDSRVDILNKKLTAVQIQKIKGLASKRIRTRKPLSYLTNKAYFAELLFYVDERVIIPRSPFAELIQNQFMPWVDSRKVKKILDVCTGSGCMAIAAAHFFPKAAVTAVDISKEALAVAKINVKKHRLTKRVKLIESDLWQKVPKQKYDLIMSNPPYVSESEMKRVPKEYDHEPRLALFAEDEGMAIVLRILKKAARYLSKKGILVIEAGGRRKQLEKLFPNIAFIWLDFARGGEDVFLLTADQVKKIGSLL